MTSWSIAWREGQDIEIGRDDQDLGRSDVRACGRRTERLIASMRLSQIARVSASTAAASRVLPVVNERTGNDRDRLSLLTRYGLTCEGLAKGQDLARRSRPRSGISCMIASVIKNGDAELFDRRRRARRRHGRSPSRRSALRRCRATPTADDS